jgi:hypothetical protein
MRVQALSEIPPLTLPPSPPRIVPTIAPAPPPDPALLTLDRLPASVQQ